MGIFRSYLSKNNTIINKSLHNTAKNEVVELSYGNLKQSLATPNDTIFTRVLIAIDFENIKKTITKEVLKQNMVVSHKLKMWNTINLRKDLIGKNVYDNSRRAYGVSVKLYKMNEHWLEGVGHDFNYETTFMVSDDNSTKPSNWFKKNILDDWAFDGVLNNSMFLLGQQYFENGDENLEIDVTTDVDGVLFDDVEHYGYLLAFDISIEGLDDDWLNKLHFFSKYTQTFFEPFLETEYVSEIRDDRDNFFIGEDNKLVIKSKSEPLEVVFYDDCDLIYDNSTVINALGNGFYSVDINIPESQNYPDFINFTDEWVFGDGSKTKKKFMLKKAKEFGKTVLDEYFLHLKNFKNKSVFLPENIRRFAIETKTLSGKKFDKTVKYSLYVLQGNNRIEIIPNTKTNSFDNEYWFDLDFSWLIPKTYYLTLQVFDNDDVALSDVFLNEFEVVVKKM